MLYLDYSRKAGRVDSEQYGGNENLEAIDFLRRFNEVAHQVPGAITIAEESTAFPGVSKPVYLNGLGFTMKWNMGWMHDMLHYFARSRSIASTTTTTSPSACCMHLAKISSCRFRMTKWCTARGSLLDKMPGDEWQQFANVRAVSRVHVGASRQETAVHGVGVRPITRSGTTTAPFRGSLLQFDSHRKLQNFVQELNQLYRANPALYEVDFHYKGFEWVDFHDCGKLHHRVPAACGGPEDFVLFCCNFTPVPRKYRVRRAGGGLLPGDSEYRFRVVRRQQYGQWRTCFDAAPPSHGRPFSCRYVASPGGGCVQTPRLIFSGSRTTGAIRLTTERGAQESYDIHFCTESFLR